MEIKLLPVFGIDLTPINLLLLAILLTKTDYLPLKLRPTVKEIPRNLKKPSIEIQLKEIDKKKEIYPLEKIHMNTNW